MKWLFFLITFFFFTQSYSQAYPKMVVEGATWMYRIHQGGSNIYFAYHIKGDTTINGVQYAILNDQGLDLSSDGLLSLNSSSVPLAYLREDDDAKKVFAIIDEATTFGLSFGLSLETFEESHLLGENEDEYLLYDFSQDVGDYLGTEVDAEVSNIETVENLGYDVRKFELSTGKPFFEIFGYNEGLFFPHHIFFIDFTFITQIQYCVTANFECDVLAQPLKVNNLSASEFLVFPNPTDNNVTIRVPNEKIQSVQFFTAEGKLVYMQNEIDSKEFSVDLTSINYTGLIYVLGITDNSRFAEHVVKY